MKFIQKHILLISIGFLYPMTGLLSQGTLVLDRSKAKVDPAIPAEMLATLAATLEKSLADYAHYSTLYDKGEKSVNSASVNQFISLFDASTAMLVKDYLFDSIPTQYDINDYFISVLEGPMSSKGIEAEVSGPVLVEVYRDPNATDQIVSTVLITKVLKNYQQATGTGYFLKPVSRKLVLTYRTPSYYLEEALISSIAYYSSEAISSKPVAVAPAPTTQVQGRCVLIDASTVLPEGVNEDTLALLEKLVCDALDEYRATASLLDSTAGAVTGASASRFQQLFSSGASLHLSDYREYPENIEVTAYREDVFKFFRNSGVQFELSNARIKSISYDPDGFYFVKVLATKEVPQYLDDESYEIKESGKKRSFEFEIDYIIVERVMSDPLIERAISTAIVKPEEKRTLLSFGPNLTSGLVSGTPISGYEYITDNTTLGSTLGLGFQLDLISNFLAKHRAPKKPLFLATGLSFQTFTLEAEGTNLIYNDSLNTIDGLQGIQSKEIFEIKDKIPMKVIGIPLGIEYRLIGAANKKFELFLGGKIVPTYLLGGESSFSADGFYNLTYEQFGFSFYDDQNQFQLKPQENKGVDSLYGIGRFNVDDNRGSEFASKFLLGYKLETSMLLSLSANFYLNARIGYGGYFGEIIASNDTTPPKFPLSDKPKDGQNVSRNTLFEDYYNSIKLSYLSFSVGLAYRLN